jgi:hypothetical protein
VSSPLSLHESIKKAFGSEPDCLGIIIVKDLPPEYVKYRERLLLLAEKFSGLQHETREKYADAKSRYRYVRGHRDEKGGVVGLTLNVS